MERHLEKCIWRNAVSRLSMAFFQDVLVESEIESLPTRGSDSSPC